MIDTNIRDKLEYIAITNILNWYINMIYKDFMVVCKFRSQVCFLISQLR